MTWSDAHLNICSFNGCRWLRTCAGSLCTSPNSVLCSNLHFFAVMTSGYRSMALFWKIQYQSKNPYP
ncbi:hypothetical protein SRHO_G00197950 [Serrasalmus rhombeus]